MKNLNSKLHKIKYLCYSIITIGIVFKTNYWPGATALIIAGGLTLSVVFLIYAFGNSSTDNNNSII
jgi:hypothetical protein